MTKYTGFIEFMSPFQKLTEVPLNILVTVNKCEGRIIASVYTFLNQYTNSSRSSPITTGSQIISAEPQ